MTIIKEKLQQIKLQKNNDYYGLSYAVWVELNNDNWFMTYSAARSIKHKKT